jgi:flagellar motor switch protein FliN/FliY
MNPLQQIAHFADVPVPLEVELDRKLLKLRQILDLERGSVLAMTRSAGENIDIYIGGTLIGYGEVVVIENTLGVRVTDFKGED